MSSDDRKTWGVVLEPFAHPTFRRIWSANLLSLFGSLIQSTGAAWMMTTLTDSSNMVAYVQASMTLPVMFFSLPAGAIADNYNRKHVMMAANCFMFAISVALAISCWLGTLEPWQLLMFTFLVGCGTALNNPAWQASIPDIVPRPVIPSAVTLNSIGFNLARSVAPALGGIIIAAAGVGAAFASNAFSYLGLIAVLFLWKPSLPTTMLPREGVASAMGAGLRYVTMSPNIGNALIRSFLFGLGVVASVALLPLVAKHHLGGGPKEYGMLLGAVGLGGVIGAIIMGRLQSVLTIETIIRWSFGTSAFCVWTAALSSNGWLTGVGLFFGGMAWVSAFSRFNVTVQLSTPRWVLGRALAIYQAAVFAGLAIGSWLWGTIAEATSVKEALIIAGFTLCAGGALGVLYPQPKQEALDLDPLNRWREPPLSLDLKPRSGPIVIEVEFVIVQEDVPEFLAAMSDRRRVRLRDGAQNWTLMRDLHDPSRWTMSYQFPTWVDYVRHNQRTTQADAVIGDRIWALHRGDEPPRVRRMILRQPSGSLSNVEF